MDLAVALGDKGLVMAPGSQGLLEDKEQFWTPVALEGAGDEVAGGFNAMVFEGGELLWVTLAGQDGIEDGQAGDTGQIADDVVDLEIHLGQGLLKVLDVGGSVADQGGAMAQEGADGTDMFWRPEAGAEQPDRMEILEPLTIGDVGFAAGEIFAMAGVDQANFQSGGFEDLEEGNPIDAGRFHGEGFNATGFEPVAQLEQIIGEGGEGADGFGIGIVRNGDLDLGGADVDAGGVGMEGGQLGVGFGFEFGLGGHRFAFVRFEWRADGPKRVGSK